MMRIDADHLQPSGAAALGDLLPNLTGKNGIDRAASVVVQDHARLPRPTACDLGTYRQGRNLIHHAAGDIHCSPVKKGRQILVLWQRCAPVQNAPKALGGLMGHQGLPVGIQPVEHYLTAPSVRPAMKCFCMAKNIATGGRAATIEPALIM